MGIKDVPPALQDYLRAIYERARPRIEAVIRRHGLRPGLSHALARERIAILDEEMALVVELARAGGKTIACAKGCRHCCTHTVDVTPDEAFALADELAATLPPDALAALKQRALAGDAIGHGLGRVARHRKHIPCPVLDPATGACLGHAARPNPCQAYLSTDLPRCIADALDPPKPVEQPSLAPMVANIIDETRAYALEDAGAPRLSLELTAALVSVWREPDAEARWLAGEEIFPDARSAPPEA